MIPGRITRLAIGVGLFSVTIGSLTWTVVFILGSAGGVQPLSKLIIDTDAGIDDAVALFFALTDKMVQVQAITCVKGNTNIDNVVINVLKVLRICNKTNVPVYAGNDYGLMTNLDVVNYFGLDGLGDLNNFPNPPSVFEKQKENAAVQLVKLVRENPGEFTLVFLGPLTNLALAISLYPDFLSKVKRIIIMGGSLRGLGNQSPGVEFNFYFDPDAASLVLQRAALFSQTVTIVALEPINEADISMSWRWEQLGKIKSKLVTFLNEIEKWNEITHSLTIYRPYDSGAMAVALIPKYVTASQQLFAQIDPYGQSARGVLLIDYYNTTKKRPNVDFVTEINSKMFQDHMYNNFKNY